MRPILACMLAILIAAVPCVASACAVRCDRDGLACQQGASARVRESSADRQVRSAGPATCAMAGMQAGSQQGVSLAAATFSCLDRPVCDEPSALIDKAAGGLSRLVQDSRLASFAVLPSRSGCAIAASEAPALRSTLLASLQAKLRV